MMEKTVIIFWVSSLILTLLGFYFLPWGFILIWSGISWFLVGLAYFSLGVKVFGKNPKGNMSILSRLFLLPYLLFNSLIWNLRRLLLQEDCYNEIIPRLFVGRRCFAQELPDNINVIVDLTAEFIEPPGITEGKTYICVPTLDASVPENEAFINLVQNVSSYYDQQKTIYIHCALGHGRAAAIAAGFLLSQDLVADVNEALTLLKHKRSVVKLNSEQIAGLQKLFTRKNYRSVL